MEEWIVTLAPALTGLLGAWVGASVALRKFKRQRGFDRRLDWYERTIRAMQRASYALDKMGSWATSGDSKRFQVWAKRYRKALRKIELTAAERFLYAPLPDRIILEKAIHEFTDELTTIYRQPSEKFGEEMRDLAAKMLTFTDQLAAGIRNELE